MPEDSFLDSSESEEAYEPQDAPVEDEKEAEPEPVVAKPAEKAPVKQPVVAKPIKDRGPKRAQLPGVIGKDASDLFGKTPRDDVKRLVAKQDAKERANRDKEPDDDQIVRPPGEAAPAKTPEPGKEVAAAKFKFADEEYESQEAAEQKYKSLQGMFRPLKESADLSTHNFKASQSWMETTKAVLAGTLAPEQQAALRQQLGIVNVPPVRGHHSSTGGAKDDDLLSGVDLGAFATIAADPDGGLEVAGRYLAEEILRSVKEKLLPQHEQKIRGEYQPLLADQEQVQLARTTEAVLESVSGYQFPGSSEPAFPELRDPVAVEDIGRLWKELGRPINELVTPAGLMQAVANYRLFRRPASGASPTVAAAARTPQPAPGAAASLSDSGRGSGAGAARPAQSQKETLLDRLKDTKMLDGTLGFSKNRRVKGIE